MQLALTRKAKTHQEIKYLFESCLSERFLLQVALALSDKSADFDLCLYEFAKIEDKLLWEAELCIPSVQPYMFSGSGFKLNEYQYLP